MEAFRGSGAVLARLMIILLVEKTSRVRRAGARKANIRLRCIALGTGFYDQSAFTKQFRRRLNAVPTAYRRQYRRPPPRADLT